MIFYRVTIVLMLAALSVFPQNLETKRNDLSKIREEIEHYETKLKSESVKEANILDIVSNLDHEIDLIHALVEQLKKEEANQSKAIVNVAYTIKDKHQELDQLTGLYQKRLVNFYKHGRRKDIELLASSSSFNQVLLWIKYQKLLAANDRRNYFNILKKKEIIETEKDALKRALLKNRKILKEKDKEEAILIARKEERRNLLSQVQQNKQLYLKKLNEYEISAKEIERLITVEEERRIRASVDGKVEKTDFPSLRGKMMWPTSGKIVTGFGKYKHPTLNTITENIGIDIKADYGEEVRVVGDGVVTAITWQRGRGNIVIVNHFGGYYTVYTHLSNIFVQIDNEVKAGQIIGEVGDSGSLKGPMLHFEIWQNNKILNPEQWLS